MILTSCLRGVNATAVGLVYTAVYRLWQIGYLHDLSSSNNNNNKNGNSDGEEPLNADPWWVVITATTFVLTMWFRVPVAVAILLGGVMGLIWFGVVR